MALVCRTHTHATLCTNTHCSLSSLPWIFTLFEHMGWLTIITTEEREKNSPLPSFNQSPSHYDDTLCIFCVDLFRHFFGIMTITQRMLSLAIIIHRYIIGTIHSKCIITITDRMPSLSPLLPPHSGG